MSKEITTVNLESRQIAIIRQFAKDNGYPSTSSALRRIVEEWVQLKAKERDLEHVLMDRATCAPYSD